MSNRDQGEQHLAAFLATLDVVAGDSEMIGTAARVTDLYRELFRGVHEAPPGLSAFENPNEDGSPVLIRELHFHSMCAHHLLPFFGHIDIAYVPARRVGGVGAFPRVVGHFAARPQVQERLVRDIADHIEAELEPAGLLVFCTARQLCMEMRGARSRGRLTCSAASGVLAPGGSARTEVLSVLGQ